MTTALAAAVSSGDMFTNLAVDQIHKIDNQAKIETHAARRLQTTNSRVHATVRI
jgi:hypothetical protein